MKPILAITGKAGSGKDTLANHLIDVTGATKRLFAGPLKEMCCRLFGWDLASLENLEYKESPSGHIIRPSTTQLVIECANQFGWDVVLTVPLTDEQATIVAHVESVVEQCTPDVTRRKILQLMGTEAFRTIDPEHWVKKALQAIDATAGPVVITDLRFPNEALSLKPLNALLIRVEKIGGPTTEHAGHASETHVDSIPVDEVISVEFGKIDELLQRGRAAARRAGFAA